MSDDEDAISAMRQRFFTADEVYVYKIPPLASAGGHRAEDWNLAKPLATCTLLVERRGDALVLEFQQKPSENVFALATVDVAKGGKVQQFLEQVVDSSRYFSVKIQGEGGREAIIGFGFRDRDQATDLRESIQHYERSIERENSATTSHLEYNIPKLQDGEQIHVNVGGKTTKSSTVRKKPAGDKGVPLLKKPPPPGADEAPNATPAPAKKATEKITMDMGNVKLDNSAEDDEDGSDGAVYVGDAEQWSTEFDMK